ncbi:MAG: hypothetical protein M1833_001606 [Piccolia ochrophora]|nr:MAG: hypothetical protein M1833_001606 [Piccolia ochrophora]
MKSFHRLHQRQPRSPLSSPLLLLLPILPHPTLAQTTTTTAPSPSTTPTQTLNSTPSPTPPPPPPPPSPATAVLNYYFLLLLILAVLLFLLYRLRLRRKRAKSARRETEWRDAARRSRESRPRGLRWITYSDWRRRRDAGAEGRGGGTEEGLDEWREAPPPYSMPEEPGSAVGRGRENRYCRGEGAPVPLRRLESVGKPPDYEETGGEGETVRSGDIAGRSRG